MLNKHGCENDKKKHWIQPAIPMMNTPIYSIRSKNGKYHFQRIKFNKIYQTNIINI
jgi:hypothetical protein